MLKNSAGFNLPSYFSSISGLNVRADDQWTCRNSRVKAGHPPSKGRYPLSRGMGSSTSGPLRLSDWRWVLQNRSMVTHTSSLRLSFSTRRWSRRAQGLDEAIDTSLGSKSCGSGYDPCAGYRRVDSIVGVAPPVWPAAQDVVACGGRDGSAHCDPPASAKPIKR